MVANDKKVSLSTVVSPDVIGPSIKKSLLFIILLLLPSIHLTVGVMSDSTVVLEHVDF